MRGVAMLFNRTQNYERPSSVSGPFTERAGNQAAFFWGRIQNRPAPCTTGADSSDSKSWAPDLRVSPGAKPGGLDSPPQRNATHWEYRCCGRSCLGFRFLTFDTETTCGPTTVNAFFTTGGFSGVRRRRCLRANPNGELMLGWSNGDSPRWHTPHFSQMFASPPAKPVYHRQKLPDRILAAVKRSPAPQLPSAGREIPDVF